MIDFNSAPDSLGGGSSRWGGPRGGASPIPHNDHPAFLDSLNDRQREAVLHTDGPLIVLAGAGSGKTKMLTARVAYLIQAKRVAPHQILAVTFTNKAAAEMKERVSKLLGDHPLFIQPEIGTFHAICVRLIRREAQATTFTKPFVIYDDSDQLSLIKRVVDKLGIDEKAFNPKSFQYAINRAKCDAIEPQDMEPAQHNLFEKKLKHVYELYQKDLFANNAIDFGEIICLAYRILRDNPVIRAKYQERFRYIHVDEYQDTNRAQYLFLSMLAKREYGGHQNICVVGDEDQSIYGWRGADIKNILDFENDYPGAAVVKLEQNYRSTKTIITAASRVIANNKTRKDKTLWTDNESGVPISRFLVPDERAEAEHVVNEIKRIATNEGRRYGEFAIFYRTHAQSRQFEDVLRREKIPYQIVGGLRFYDRKEIKDILSYFKVILNPSDSISLKRIINVPARGIGKTTLDRLDDLHTKMESEGEIDPTLWGAVQRAAKDPSITSSGTAKKLAQFSDFLKRLMDEQPKLLLSELYHLILDETGYVRELRQEGTDEATARIENLEEFDSLLQEFEEDMFENLSEEEKTAQKSKLLETFIEQSTLNADADGSTRGVSPETLAMSVNMMTLHSSKGLEFPVVFLPGMEEGLFPSVRAWEETPEDEIEEERRLCYVGMTRARELLYLSHVAVRRLWGQVSYQEPARFFTEVPDELVAFRDLTSYGSASSAQLRVGSARQMGWSNPSGGSGRTGGGYQGTSSYSSVDEFSQLPEDESSPVGRKIQHPDYGTGKILSAEGSGQDVKVTVEFGGRDRRKFLFRFISKYLA